MELRLLGCKPSSSSSSEVGGVWTVGRSTTADNGESGFFCSVWLLCGLEVGTEDGGGTTRDFDGEAAELDEEIDVSEFGDLDKVDEGAVEGAVNTDDDGEASLQLATDEKDDDEPVGVGR